ncbi:class I SAM-dependent methyltransferase [Patescibacteria group bacterium]|nr:class I SAM-dependent methyltransferase [Patescibacteria group bacterium]MCG2702536.1 class I SAM-dependent methyltransferase [Candidatus Parcubacteria bacterium]MBU4265112.1 class I SAM-dependent methyltransferase [Patescibacteria group bacterium]MBU4390676.1 class I SAM-dependent methyltransferase [Patescibacteria group bacterium]MBU4397467.1 class I SAM-dependent methyltransferase [Patescibacteria group bacterium]
MFEYSNGKEPFLEPILRKIRFNVIKKFLLNKNQNEWLILDYGCGPKAKFYKYLKDKNIRFKKYIGYDPLNKNNTTNKKQKTTSNFKKILNQKYDLITMFAVLEHLDYPNHDFSFLSKILKKNSYLIITTPTKIAKPILEFLSYKLKIISKREIKEHKHYYNLQEIEKIFSVYGLEIVQKRYFELGMNNLVILKTNNDS